MTDVDGFHCESFSWWREKKQTLTLNYLIQKMTSSDTVLFVFFRLTFILLQMKELFFFKSHLFLKKEILCLIFLHRSNVENRRIFPCSSEPLPSTGFHFQAVVKLAATRGRKRVVSDRIRSSGCCCCFLHLQSSKFKSFCRCTHVSSTLLALCG